MPPLSVPPSGQTVNIDGWQGFHSSFPRQVHQTQYCFLLINWKYTGWGQSRFIAMSALHTEFILILLFITYFPSK